MSYLGAFHTAVSSCGRRPRRCALGAAGPGAEGPARAAVRIAPRAAVQGVSNSTDYSPCSFRAESCRKIDFSRTQLENYKEGREILEDFSDGFQIGAAGNGRSIAAGSRGPTRCQRPSPPRSILVENDVERRYKRRFEL